MAAGKENEGEEAKRLRHESCVDSGVFAWQECVCVCVFVSTEATFIIFSEMILPAVILGTRCQMRSRTGREFVVARFLGKKETESSARTKCVSHTLSCCCCCRWIKNSDDDDAHEHECLLPTVMKARSKTSARIRATAG